ncbi:MAG: dynamin family protein [Rikenellaceae bacterium]
MIIYIVIAVIITGFLTFFVAKKMLGGSNDNQLAKQLKSQNEELQSEAKKHISELSKLNDDRCDLEAKLKEAKEEKSHLETKLQDLINGSPEAVSSALSDEILRCKKKIKGLEEDLEEIEDEKDDLDKKVKKLKEFEQKCYDLQSDLRTKDKEIRQITDELSNLQEELRDVESDRNLKSESIQFVQDILSATEVNDKQVDYEKINILVDFIHEDLKKAIDSSLLQGENKDLFDAELYKWANIKKKSWIDGKTTIAFVGEFSAGKTSIVNRILSQDDPDAPQLPVSAKAATAIPTYISGGIKTEFEFVAPDSARKRISEESFKNIKKEVLDQVKGISSLITYFIMTYKNDKLKKLSILDTPGFNSSDKEDAERTIGVINECDALFWVIDVNAGEANMSSVNLIKEHLKKPLYVVINKVDTKAVSETDKVEVRIKQTFEKEGVEIKDVIRFSGKEPVQNIMDPIMSVEQNSTQDSYIDRLYEFLEQPLNTIKQEVTKRELNYKNAQQDYDSLVTAFSGVISKIVSSCRQAAAIPQAKEGFLIFSKDRFEMPKAAGDNMLRILRDVQDNQSRILEQSNRNTSDGAKKVQSEYEAYNRALGQKRTLSDLKAKLERLNNELKN